MANAVLASVFLVAGVATAVLGRIAWRVTAGFSHGAARWIVRCLIMAVFLRVATALVFEQELRGTWMCVACGEERDEYRYVGFRLAVSEPTSGASRVAQMERYQTWFRLEIAGEHDHDWMPVGSLFQGLGTSITCMFPGKLIYRHLPVLRDQDVAKSLAGDIYDSLPDQRRELLRSFDREVRRFLFETKANRDFAEELAPLFDLFAH